MYAPIGAEVVEEYHDRDGNVKGYDRRKMQDAKVRLAHCGDAFGQWLESQQRREYRDYDFCVDPAQADPEKYNICCGKFLFEHMEAPYDLDVDELARIQPILQHYNTVFCDGNLQIATYLWNWFALPLQRKGLKMEVAVVIQVQPHVTLQIYIALQAGPCRSEAHQGAEITPMPASMALSRSR